MRIDQLTTEAIQLSPRSERARAWIEKVYAQFPQTWQNNHVMMLGGKGDDAEFAMFELEPSLSKRDAVEVKWFQAYPQRQGVGTRAMRRLQDLASEDGIALTLYPWNKGQVSQGNLIKFYRHTGFKPSAKGAKTMVWEPALDEAKWRSYVEPDPDADPVYKGRKPQQTTKPKIKPRHQDVWATDPVYGRFLLSGHWQDRMEERGISIEDGTDLIRKAFDRNRADVLDMPLHERFLIRDSKQQSMVFVKDDRFGGKPFYVAVTYLPRGSEPPGHMDIRHVLFTGDLPSKIKEGLTHTDPVERWVAVFKASKHPKFADKTPEQREKMARAAQYRAVQNQKPFAAKPRIKSSVPSLSEAAKTGDAQLDALLAANPQIKDANATIVPGQQIKLPNGSSYTIARNDNLWNISRGKTRGTVQAAATAPTSKPSTPAAQPTAAAGTDADSQLAQIQRDIAAAMAAADENSRLTAAARKQAADALSSTMAKVDRNPQLKARLAAAQKTRSAAATNQASTDQSSLSSEIADINQREYEKQMKPWYDLEDRARAAAARPPGPRDRGGPAGGEPPEDYTGQDMGDNSPGGITIMPKGGVPTSTEPKKVSPQPEPTTMDIINDYMDAAARFITDPAYSRRVLGLDQVKENMDHSKDGQAVPELKAALLRRKRLIKSKADDKDAVYDIINGLMTSVAKAHGISGQKLHDLWVDQYGEIPDTWILHESVLPGSHTPTEAVLAKQYTVGVAEIKRQLKKGIKIELEHTTDRAVAREIALDHLGENLYYYDRLKQAGLEEAKDYFKGSKFGDEQGRTWSVETVIDFAKSDPKYLKKDFPLSKIKHDLDWWEDTPAQRERMKNADVSYPLLVLKNDDGHLSVADGLNRMKKAVDVLKQKTIDVYLVPKKDIIDLADSDEKLDEAWLDMNEYGGWITPNRKVEYVEYQGHEAHLRREHGLRIAEAFLAGFVRFQTNARAGTFSVEGMLDALRKTYRIWGQTALNARNVYIDIFQWRDDMTAQGITPHMMFRPGEGDKPQIIHSFGVKTQEPIAEAKKRKAKTIIDGMIKTLIKQGRTRDEAIADLKKQVDSRFYEAIDLLANGDLLEENLRDWFKQKWVRFGPDGRIRGSCARGSDSEGKPKCLPAAKAHALGKKKRATAARRKRREDPNPERHGKAKNVKTKESVAEHTCPHCGGAMYEASQIAEKQDACYYKVKSRYKVWPSAYASGALVQCRKKGAKNWGKSKAKESVMVEDDHSDKMDQLVEEIYEAFHNGFPFDALDAMASARVTVNDDPRLKALFDRHRADLADMFLEEMRLDSDYGALAQMADMIESVGIPMPDPRIRDILQSKSSIIDKLVSKNLSYAGISEVVLMLEALEHWGLHYYLEDFVDLEDGKDDVIRSLLKLYKANRTKEVADIIQRLREEDVDWPELVAIEKSLGAGKITETRDAALKWLKSYLPAWPDYVVRDWLYQSFKGDFGQGDDSPKSVVDKVLGGEGMDAQTQWQFVPNFQFSMDRLTPWTVDKLQARWGGKEHQDMPGIPRDAERHDTQAALAAQQGGVRDEPVILKKVGDQYELIEGWHRTIQHFKQFPDGYKGPAWIAIDAKPVNEEEQDKQITWTKPNLDFEWEEIPFQSKAAGVPNEVRQYLQQHFPDKATWLRTAQQGRVVTIPADHSLDIENSPHDEASLMHALRSDQDPGGPGKAARAEQAFRERSVEMPIILNTGDRLWLIGGKTRLGYANYILKIPAKVWMIGDNLSENFADGKGPGRKGDSQRHGIPKGATMAQLEKAAKASGRKGQLARWQLNMRRGRAKAHESEEMTADQWQALRKEDPRSYLGIKDYRNRKWWESHFKAAMAQARVRGESHFEFPPNTKMYYMVTKNPLEEGGGPPHGTPENELAMMKARTKPAVTFLDMGQYEEMYEPNMEHYDWIKQKWRLPNMDVNYYVIGQPGQEARVKRIGQLIYDMNKNGQNPTADYHRELGRLLGYSEADINSFLKDLAQED